MIALLNLKPYTGDVLAPSPNHGPRRLPMIRGIVLHATADKGDEALSVSWMRSPKSQVSCHLVVGREGKVTRLVGDQQRAWHAGIARWRGTDDVNSITLGIEIANRNDGEPFTRAQYRKVADIAAHYCRQGLSLDDVVSHEQIAEGRKTDPLGWDWDHFRSMVRYRLRPSHEPPPLRLPSFESGPRIEDSTSESDGTRVLAASSAQRTPVRRIPKSVLSSRTIWVNGMTVIASGGMLIADALDLAHRLGITLPEDVIKWALFGIGLVNIVLRLKTTQPLTCGQETQPTAPEPPVQRALQAQVVMTQARAQAARPVAVIQSGRSVPALG